VWSSSTSLSDTTFRLQPSPSLVGLQYVGYDPCRWCKVLSVALVLTDRKVLNPTVEGLREGGGGGGGW